MKSLFSIALLLASTAIFAYELDRSALETGGLSFISHHTPVPFGTYLTQEVPFAPIKDLRIELEKTVGTLINRGEAHITVITPVEYDQVLASLITIQEINQIALKNKIQSAIFMPVCIGSGEKEIDGKVEKAYFVVVKSPELLKIREQIQKLFIKRGGKDRSFKAEPFYSHITLGFTLRDLHEADGVLKDERNCLSNGKIQIK